MKAAAVFYVMHLERMRLFYQRCFGFDVVDQAPDYCVLESDAWSLSLVVVPQAIAAGIHLTTPATPRSGTPIKLAFAVAEIDAARKRVTEMGGRVADAGTVWDFRGNRHGDAVDPEGNVVQLLEPMT